ncbi:hypothetical protein LJC64_03610 [Ruminococcaceae bacterium OttesenSCG-928-A11]|nr:hypothetical protein [Ruminococcaceae bacterium OttesenSCG-928-A11]
MQPDQQPNTPSQAPTAAPVTPPVAPNTAPPTHYGTNIQAPSQENLRPTVKNLTTTNAPHPQMQTPQPAQQVPVQPQPQLVQQPPQNKQVTQKPPEQKLSKKQQKQFTTAQNSLLISEIRENMVIMNDGSFRAVIACESINYDLMSQEERDGIEYSYQNFLNTINFPIQIAIQSKRIDIKPYLEKLERIRSEQENMLLGVLMDDYLDFVFDISQQANIMRKEFFIIVPYKLGGDDTNEFNLRAMIDNTVTEFSPKNRVTINAANYSDAKTKIKNRVGLVLSGLMNIGVRAGQLPTQALGELYYNFYNPDTALNEPIGELKQYTSALFTKKGEGEAPMNRSSL